MLVNTSRPCYMDRTRYKSLITQISLAYFWKKYSNLQRNVQLVVTLANITHVMISGANLWALTMMVILAKNNFAGLIVMMRPKPNVGMEMTKMAAAREVFAWKMKMSKTHATTFTTIMEILEMMEAGAKFKFWVLFVLFSFVKGENKNKMFQKVDWKEILLASSK